MELLGQLWVRPRTSSGAKTLSGEPLQKVRRTLVAAVLTQVHDLTLLSRVHAVGGWL